MNNSQQQGKQQDGNNELKNKLKHKINDQSLKRSSNVKKELLIDKNFKKLGIDKQKFKDDLEAVKKQGGFSEEQMKKIMDAMSRK
jgi:hypothetical protein